MNESLLYRVLDVPWVYRVQQAVLAAGIEKAFTRKIQELRAQLPPARRLLDVGCGPVSWLHYVDMHPVGADLSWRYVRDYTGRGERGVVASADGLPFANASFDGVWSIGLLHHLPEPVANATLREMVRVCARGGYVAVIDAVMPARAWRRPLAYVLRRLDRGGFVRSETGLGALFPPEHHWKSDRFTFAATGLEAVACWAQLER